MEVSCRIVSRTPSSRGCHRPGLLMFSCFALRGSAGRGTIPGGDTSCLVFPKSTRSVHSHAELSTPSTKLTPLSFLCDLVR